jgi:NADH-quinone oxidoreductase subunit H
MSESVIRLLVTISVILGSVVYGFITMSLSRRITARVQNRIGPPLKQPFVDVIKLYSKRTFVTHGIMQTLGPILLMTGIISTLILIPYGTGYLSLYSSNGDLITILYIMTFGQLAMALAIGQGGNPNGAIGVARGLTRMLGYELPLVLALISLIVLNHSADVNVIIANQQGGIANWNAVRHPIVGITALLALLGMMGNQPFDNPSAPAEVASGPLGEFGGKFMAIMMTSNAMFIVAKLVLLVGLFFGGASNLFVLAIKIFLLYLYPLFVGLVFPRFAMEDTLLFFWKWPTVIGFIGLAIAIF